MEIQWLGTAGFRVQASRAAFLIDPYLSRNSGAVPRQRMRPADLGPASHIFISHGHFDHLMDVPAIAWHTGAVVWCSPTAARTLADMGVDPAQIRPVADHGQEALFGGVRARACHSRHIRFDWGLMVSTLVRIGRQLPGTFPLLTHFPCGRVFSWQFELEGRRIHFFGSAGATARELKQLKSKPIHILLIPLQGHSRICSKAAEQVRMLKPDLVIPHHHDDFFPPVSQTVDITSFVDRVRQSCPGTQVRVMEINEVISF